MKNRFKLLINVFIIIIIYILLSSFILIYQNKKYEKNYNESIGMIVSYVKEKYPSINQNDIISILNNKQEADYSIFSQYGIDVSNDDIIAENQITFRKTVILNIVLIIILFLAIIGVWMIYYFKQYKSIKNITNCIKEINKKNYKIKVDENSEDELSILKNEIYKTTIMLKEDAENSKSDKINLKKNLEDISHQLKTPLTAINILLDNLLDNPDMDEKTRMEFLKDISRNIANINFLVQTLLKLSRFDVNEVSYNYKNIKLKDIIDRSCKNIESLCDLKNVKIKCDLSRDIDIYCDFYWQVEAISNILKNCVEYSNESSDVIIKFSENDVYILIEIIDSGKGMSEEEQKHIFERFYKGKNSNNESFGIGLALAKTIIEKNNGKINVESKLGEGTKFSIRYYKF